MTTTQLQAAKRNMEATLSAVAGCPVEITFRAGIAMTFSTAERNDEAAAKLAAFLKEGGKHASVTVEHDDECGSFVYAD